MVEPGESLVQALVVVPDGVGRVDVEGGAVLLGQRLQADVLTVEGAVAVGESVHGGMEGQPGKRSKEQGTGWRGMLWEQMADWSPMPLRIQSNRPAPHILLVLLKRMF